MPVAKSTKPTPRLRDIADHARLSVTAVSMALRGSEQIAPETRARIAKLARRMGYAPRLSARRTRGTARPQRRFGLCIVGATQGSSSDSLIRGASRAAVAAGARVEVITIEDASDRERVLEQASEFARHLDGVLVWGFV